jgi:UDP-glucose 4-epimerase
MATALVTGGAGFIGSHVADLFLSRGFDVEIIDDFSTGRRENVAGGIRVHEMDIRSVDAARVVERGGFDVIAHLAAQIDVRKSVADPVSDASVNIVGSLNVLEALRRSASASRARVVFSSTGGALYGDFVSPPNIETYPKDPESPYAIAKLSVEHYLAYYGRVHGMKSVALRFGNVYGPRQDPHGEAGVVAIFCGRLLEGRPLTVFGDGLQTRDYVYVTDVAEATFRAATAPLPPADRLDARGFNIGTGVGTPVLRLAELLRAAAGSDSAATGRATALVRLDRQSEARIGMDSCCLARGRPCAQLRVVRRPHGAPLSFVIMHVGFFQTGGAIPSTPVELIANATTVTQVVLALLVALSLLSWAIMFGVSRALRKAFRAADSFGREFERVDRLDEAGGLAKRSPPGVMPRLFTRAMHFVSDSRGANQVETLHLLLESEASAERDRLGRFLPWLATIGSVSPLIGLLGTVLGVIEAFIGIATKGSGNLSAVAPGVAEALIATAAALAVAIPATFGYNILANRLNGFDGRMENFSTTIITLLVREGRI